MWNAASTFVRYGALLAVVTAFACLAVASPALAGGGHVTVGLGAGLIPAANAFAAAPKSRPDVPPTPVWGVALDGRQSDEPNLELLSQAKAAGLNAIVTDPKRWSPARHQRLVKLAQQLGMLLIEPRRPVQGSSDLDGRKRCVEQRRIHQPCAVVAISAAEAIMLARRTPSDYVVVRLDSPTELQQLAGSRSSRAQVIAVLTVGATARLDATWDRAVAAAAGDRRRTIAVGLSGSFAAVAVQSYFDLLDRHGVTSRTFDGQRNNGNGNGNGPDRLPPTTPLGGTVTNATATDVSLSWIASTDNLGVDGYGVYVNGSLVGSTGATAFTVRGLSCGSSYTFAIDAYDKRRNRSTRLVFTGSTGACPAPAPAPAPVPAPAPQSGPNSPPPDTTPPSQPAGLTTAGVTASSMTLNWGASTDNIGVSGYEISKDGVSAGSTSSNSYLLAGLSCGTSYSITVKAYDAAGNRSQAAAITAVTSACSAPADTQAPSIPGNFHVTAATVDSISVAWSPSTDNTGVTGYGVYNDGTPSGSTNSTAYTVSGLTCGSVHILALDAYDAAANHSARATLTTSTSACPPAADTTPPSTPTGLHAVGATPTSITVAWDPSTDGVGVTGYSVYNGSATAGTTSSTSYTVSSLMCGATYSLAVDAYDAAGNHSSKATANIPTNACAPPPPAADTQPPTAPAGPQVLSATTNSITVAWPASTDNVSVAGYGLYRGGISTGTTTTTSATFSGLSCGTTYTLSVDAYDGAGNRSSQATVSSPTSACPLSPPAPDTQAPTMPGSLNATGATTSSITIGWTASTDNVGVTGYGLYRNGASTGSSNSTSASFSGLACGTAYMLAVDAFDAAGNRSAKATITASTSACPPPADTQAPTVPGGLHMTTTTATSITVGWTASTDNVGVTGYHLYQGGSQVGTSASTSGVFGGLACGTTYTLSVDAYDAAGNRSGQASTTGVTTACSAPSAPSGCAVDRATMTAPGCTLKRDDTAGQADSVTGSWGSIDCASPTRVQYLTAGGDPGLQADGSSQGNAAFRQLTVQDGDNIYGERCEIGRNEMRYGENQPGQTTGTFALYPEGSHRITFFSERYGAGFTSALPNWQTVMQFKQAQPYAANGPVDGAPALELQIYAGRLRLHSFWNEIWTTAAPPNGVWIRYALDVTYSQDPAKGKVQVFVDLDGDGDFVDTGEASPVFSMRTLAYVTSQGSGTIPVGGSLPDHLRLGIYHDPSVYGNTTVDVDNVQVVSG